MTQIEITESPRAISCVEAAVDFSFRTAFRESWRLVSLLQIAGRASRSGEYPDTEVWDFGHDECGGLSLDSLNAECGTRNGRRRPGRGPTGRGWWIAGFLD